MVLAAACWRYGDTAVRAAASVLTIGMLAAWAGQGPIRNQHFELFQAIPDMLVFLALIACAMRWPRGWLSMMVALQLLSISGHLTKLLGYNLRRNTYAILHAGAAYPLLICLSIGLLLAIRTRRSATARSVTDWRGVTTRGTADTY